MKRTFKFLKLPITREVESFKLKFLKNCFLFEKIKNFMLEIILLVKSCFFWKLPTFWEGKRTTPSLSRYERKTADETFKAPSWGQKYVGFNRFYQFLPLWAFISPGYPNTATEALASRLTVDQPVFIMWCNITCILVSGCSSSKEN